MQLKMDLKVFEAMVYFWMATSEREKVGERYLNDLAAMDDMQVLYDKEFTRESVRKILSAISNRELFRPDNKKEGRFWNFNMWIMEDLEVMRLIIETVKSIEAAAILEELPGESEGSLEIAFIPGHEDASYVKGGKLYLNVFLFSYDFNTGAVKYIDKPVKDYLVERIKEII